MGCSGSKDGAKQGDKPTTSDAKHQKCMEIVDKLDTDNNGVMSKAELQLLVKHLYPNFINIPAANIKLDDPKIVALNGKTKAELVAHLEKTCDETWVTVFHQFLGCVEGDPPDFPECTPGVYSVVWEGGVRYRNSPNYQDIADYEQLALPETEFEISHFKKGPLGLVYGYIHWARYWLPMSFQDGRPMLKRIGDVGTSQQLEQLAIDLFNEIDTSKDGFASWEEITSFLHGAEIAYDEEQLKKDFEEADVDKNGQLDKQEFIDCYKRESIANVFCIPTKGRQNIPHPEGMEEDIANAREDKIAMFSMTKKQDASKAKGDAA